MKVATMDVNSISNFGSYAAFSGNTISSISPDDTYGLQANSDAMVSIAQIKMSGIQTQAMEQLRQYLNQTFQTEPLTYSSKLGANNLIPGFGTSTSVITPAFIPIPPKTNLATLAAKYIFTGLDLSKQTGIFNYLT